MYRVNSTIFNDFVAKNQLTETQGDIFHSSNFVDNEGNIRAYKESSSWNPRVIYKIDDETYANYESLNHFGNLVK